ncbi:MAG TPA: PEGA domain-containing protein, partial [Thermoleophilaceae bacterium]
MPFSFSRAHHWCCCLSVAALTLSTPAAAAPDPPSDEAATEARRAEAKSKYEEGADAYAAGHFKDAVDLFLAADHLAPSAPLSFNIARAYEKLGDDAGALRWYRDYLRRSPEVGNAEAVRTLIATLAGSLKRRGIQQVTVLTSPAGATVTMDDQPVGVTPWTGEISPGKHHLLLSGRGYADAERELVLVADEPLDVSVRLTPQSLTGVPQVSPPSSAPPPSPAGPPPGRKLGVLPWVTLGAGAASLGAALTFELLRRNAESDAKQQLIQVRYQQRLETEQSRQTVARVFLGAGGALLAAGGLMLLFDKPAAARGASAELLCVPGLCGVTARGQ